MTNPPRLHLFEHTPLRSDQIRLLVLHAGGFDDVLSCSLQAVDFAAAAEIGEEEGSISRRATWPRYEALSYCWADGCLEVRYMLVDGLLQAASCTLQSILQHLRHAERDRILWIDALCIDQSSDAEKAVQVPRMRDIYTRADGVVVWLGKATRLLAEIFSDWEPNPLDGANSRNESSCDQTMGSGPNKLLTEGRLQNVERSQKVDKAPEDSQNAKKREKNKTKAKSKGKQSISRDSSSDDGDDDDSDNSDDDSDPDSDEDDSEDDDDDSEDDDDNYGADGSGTSHSRHSLDLDPSMSALVELSQRRWFQRVWIVQELCLAKQVTVMCGLHTLLWDDFCNAANQALALAMATNRSTEDGTSHLYRFEQLLENMRGLSNARAGWQHRHHPSSSTPPPPSALAQTPDMKRCGLLQQLWSTRGRQCSVAADQVYGILGICADVGGPAGQPFAVNYAQSMAEVFLRTVAHCVASEDSLAVLGAAGIGDDDDLDDDEVGWAGSPAEKYGIGTAGLQRLPSWVPRWNSPGHRFPLTHFGVRSGGGGVGEGGEAFERASYAAATHMAPDYRFGPVSISAGEDGGDDDGEATTGVPALLARGIAVDKVRAVYDPLEDSEIEDLRDETSVARFIKFAAALCRAQAKLRREILPRRRGISGSRRKKNAKKGAHGAGEGDDADAVAAAAAQSFWRLLLADARLHGVTELGQAEVSTATAWLAGCERRWRPPPAAIAHDPVRARLQTALIRAVRTLHGRVFFATTANRYGIAPAATSPDDAIVVLRGAQTPLIVRDTGDRATAPTTAAPPKPRHHDGDGNGSSVDLKDTNGSSGGGKSSNNGSIFGSVAGPALELVGECYCEGFMDGEALANGGGSSGSDGGKVDGGKGQGNGVGSEEPIFILV